MATLTYPAIVTVDTSATSLTGQLGDGAQVTVVNMSLTSNVFVAYRQGISPGSPDAMIIPPLGSAVIDASRATYIVADKAGTTVQTIPGAAQWSASPAQIAEQIAITGINVNLAGSLDWSNVTLAPFNASINGTDVANAGSFNAAIATGAPVYIPSGAYLLAGNSVNIAPGMRWVGDGIDKTFITLTSALLMNTIAQTNDVQFENLTLQVTGDHIFQGCNLGRFTCDHVGFIQNSSGFSIWHASPANFTDLIEARFTNCSETVFGTTRTQPAWFLQSGGGIGQVNQCTWEHEVCFNQNKDATQYWYVLDNQDTGGQTHAANQFRDIVFEHPYGGMIKLLSCTGTHIEDVVCWDVPVTPDITNPLISIGKDSTNPSASFDNTVYKFSRRGGTLAAGVADIALDAACAQTTIISPGSDAGGSALTISLAAGSAGTKLINLPVTAVVNTTAGTNWQSMAARGYQNGWVDAGAPFPTGKYRITDDNEIEIVGNLTSPTGVATGQVILNLPAGYQPVASTMVIPCVFPVGAGAWLGLLSNGNLEVGANINAGASVAFMCKIPLDA